MNTITVKATKGLSVPMADNALKYITDKPTTVADGLYYRRRIAERDFVVVQPAPSQK